MGFTSIFKSSITAIFASALLVSTAVLTAPRVAPASTVANKSNLGIIRGVVRDNGGSPISEATVAIFTLGTSKLLKQVSSAADGSFLAKIAPGTYTVLAVAPGFNPVTLSDVEISKTKDLVYGFRLERAGSGNTLPEKRVDRNSSKWQIRAAQSQRSIYQNREGDIDIVENDAQAAVAPDDDETNPSDGRKGQAVVETYISDSKDGNYGGVNFATVVPINNDSEVTVAGQVATGDSSPLAFETELKFRPNGAHQIRVKGSVARLGTQQADGTERNLSQFSIQALDEWKVREGVIFVYGLDYSKFVGSGGDFSLSPRFGLQFDLNPKTRVRAAYTTQTEEKSWANAIDLENATVVFREPIAVEDLVFEDGKPLMNKSSRLEFGIERILDNRSSIEANAFLDTTLSQGVGLTSMPLDELAGGAFGDIVGNQSGSARGFRVVYSRRLSGIFSADAGYSFGNGKRLTANAASTPAELFETAYFQSFFGQVSADLRSGTSIKTIFRLSPSATVFAIDPFKGRLAIYDPGLSILVTQSLPTLGLPFRAEAIVDARNIFDFHGGVTSEEGSILINGQRRVLRGGISLRF